MTGRKLYLSNLRPGEVTVMDTTAGLSILKACLALAISPNVLFRLIRNQHDSSLPNTSTFIRFTHRDIKSSLTEVTATAFQVVHHACQGEVGWGKTQR